MPRAAKEAAMSALMTSSASGGGAANGKGGDNGTTASGTGAAAPQLPPQQFMSSHGWPHEQWVAAQGMAGLKEGGVPNSSAGSGPNPVVAFVDGAGGPMFVNPGGPGNLGQHGWSGFPPGASGPGLPNTLPGMPSSASSASPAKRTPGRAGKTKATGGGKKGGGGKRDGVPDLRVDIPPSCQGPGENGWHPDLLTMSTIHLNDFVTKNRLEQEQIKALKSLRRRIKNRSYTQNARARQRSGASPARTVTPDPNKSIKVVDVGVQCHLPINDVPLSQTGKA
eukprot:m.20504 g.20504  ORF g.20504 m.20504 type:complete len:280 (-) comp3797_c0_seq1:212-1051(-)